MLEKIIAKLKSCRLNKSSSSDVNAFKEAVKTEQESKPKDP